jgi:hypothetical protein
MDLGHGARDTTRTIVNAVNAGKEYRGILLLTPVEVVGHGA